jgi:hypothetical protein
LNFQKLILDFPKTILIILQFTPLLNRIFLFLNNMGETFQNNKILFLKI